MLSALALPLLLGLQGPEVPAPDGWVTDLAGLLSGDQERALEALMESYEEGSQHEIALLTVPTLGGLAIERFALEVAREWGIGKEETNAGALLVVAREERALRIEVGRGLEGTLTDSISGRIIRNVIAPEFRQGRWYDGLRKGIEAMHAAAGGDYAPIPADPGSRTGGGGFAGCVALAVNLAIVFFIFGALGRRGRRRGGMGGVLPWLVLASMSHGRARSGSGGAFGGGGFGGGGGFSGGGASGGW